MKPGTLAAIHRVRWHWGSEYRYPTDGSPYVIDCRTFDISETVCAMIRNAAPGLVAVTLSPRGGPAWIKLIERCARKRNVRILWWTYGCGMGGKGWFPDDELPTIWWRKVWTRVTTRRTKTNS